MGRNRLVTAMLIGLAIVVLLAACGGATSTPAPTATPATELASTPMPTSNSHARLKGHAHIYAVKHAG